MRARAAALLLLVGGASSLEGQSRAAGAPVPLDASRSSRADSLLARGRLRAAEDALYAAVAAKPRQPAPRGALGRYLASRGRFRVAQVLYEEAQRFGADPGIVAAAIAQMTPYRTDAELPKPVTVPFEFVEDGRTIGRFAMTGRDGRTFAATLDPSVTGLVVRSAGEPPSAVGGIPLRRPQVVVDTTLGPNDVRCGLDVLWRLGFAFDERAGTMSVGEAGVRRSGSVTYVPIVLTFPGLSLVPRPGVAPIPIQRQSARALLRGARWWFDAAEGALVVER